MQFCPECETAILLRDFVPEKGLYTCRRCGLEIRGPTKITMYTPRPSASSAISIIEGNEYYKEAMAKKRRTTTRY
jgi:DNA-directed RNA polymerase subunit M/transcription elongation factor TFIIS